MRAEAPQQVSGTATSKRSLPSLSISAASCVIQPNLLFPGKRTVGRESFPQAPTNALGWLSYHIHPCSTSLGLPFQTSAWLRPIKKILFQ